MRVLPLKPKKLEWATESTATQRRALCARTGEGACAHVFGNKAGCAEEGQRSKLKRNCPPGRRDAGVMTRARAPAPQR